MTKNTDLKTQISKQLYLFTSGFKDSLKVVPSFRRYYFSRQENISQKIHNTLSELSQRVILYFVLSIIVQALLQYLFPVFSIWLKLFHYPFLLSIYIWIIISSLFWFGDIVENSLKIERDLLQNAEAILHKKNMDNSNIQQTGSQIFKKQIFMVVYILIGILSSQLSALLPIIGPILLLLIQGTYYAMFLFMLKWSYNNYILCYFEEYISYFTGFGLIISLITYMFSFSLKDGILWYFVSDAIYYIVFTIYIFVTVNSRPPNVSNIEKFSLTNILNLEPFEEKTLFPQEKPQNNNSNSNSSSNSNKMLRNTDSTFVHFMEKLNNDKDYKRYCKTKKQGLFAPVRILTDLTNSILGILLAKNKNKRIYSYKTQQ